MADEPAAGSGSAGGAAPDRIEDLEKQVKEMSGELDSVRQELAEARAARQQPEQAPAPDPHAAMVKAHPELTDAAPELRNLIEVMGSSWLPDGSAPPYGSGPGSGWDTTLPTDEDVDRLADPPRSVPAVFRMAAFGWRGWEMFTVTMVLVTPMALWIFVPELFPVACVGCLGVVFYFRFRRFGRWMRALRWGKVATVTGAERHTTSTSYQNVMMRTARGWRATSKAYSGSGYASKVSYTLDGASGVLTVRGLPYDGGVVLANTKRPTEAICVSELPFTVQPDGTGQLTGAFSTWQSIGVGLTLLLYSSLAILAVLFGIAIYTGP